VQSELQKLLELADAASHARPAVVGGGSTTSSASSGRLHGSGQYNTDGVSNALRLPLPDTERPKGLDKEQWMLVKLTTDAIVKAKPEAGLKISSRDRVMKAVIFLLQHLFRGDGTHVHSPMWELTVTTVVTRLCVHFGVPAKWLYILDISPHRHIFPPPRRY
jgi:hypothetical protein